MKKLLILLLAFAMLLPILSACGDAAQPADTEASPSESADTAEAAVTEEITEAEVTTAVETTESVKTEDALTVFRTTCYAAGKFNQSVLDSVNPGVLALISDCLYFEDTLQEWRAKGDRWVYTNQSKYSPQSTTFDEMIASNKHGTNCAMAMGWSLIDMKVLPSADSRFWGGSNGVWAHRDRTEAYMGAVSEIYCYNGTRTFKELYEAGMIKAGDMFLAVGHTFVYLGDEKFMATGHDSQYHVDATAPSEYGSSTAVFESFVVDMRSCHDFTTDVFWLFRFKDEFVPHYYRNADGNNVKNPMYSSVSRSEYRAGKDPATADIQYMNQNEYSKQNKDTPAKKNYEIPKAATAPVIDGVGGSEWANALKITLTRDNTVDMTSTKLECQGGTFSYMWDENALYMLAEINDATPSEKKSKAGNGSYNELDGVQMCLYVDKSVTSATAGKLYFFSFCPEASDGKAYAGEHFIFSNGSYGVDVPGIEIKSVKTSTGYVVEAKIPASVLAKSAPEIKLEAGTSFPLCNVILDTNNSKSAIFADSAWFNAPKTNVYTLK